MPARFYLTTAIDYVNGRPHLGHAYEKVLADALARFHRQRGDATFFLTGTDEHGQKIARAAEAAGKAPRAFVDELVPTFTAAWKTLGVSYDKFIRTTDTRHEMAVQELFRRLNDARSPKTGEPALFEDSYEGLYCEGCEGFKQEKDLDEDGRCPEHGTRPAKIRESNFFFRLSEYDEALLKHIEAHPGFIQPEYRRNEVLNVIRDGLEDVSVTRPNLPWGIPLPDEIEGAEGHTVYVWADALLNYLSAIGWPDRKYSLWWLAKEAEAGGPGAAREDEFQHLDGQGRPGAAWAGTTAKKHTNALHLIGKDISRFHCILWPALLLAAGVPLPRQIYVHGFIYARGGKLSKSAGNVVDPVELAERFGVDALRFYLLAAIPTGRDGDFTLEQLVDFVNVRLANELGNLVSRTLAMVHKYFGGTTPTDWDPATLQDPLARDSVEQFGHLFGPTFHAKFEGYFQTLQIDQALDAVRPLVVRANELIERSKPWVLAKDPSRSKELSTVILTLLESIRIAAVHLWPAIPHKCEELWTQLGLDSTPSQIRGESAEPAFASTPCAGRAVGEVKSLFPRIELEPSA